MNLTRYNTSYFAAIMLRYFILAILILLSSVFVLRAQSAQEVKGVTITVSDLEAVAAFYQEVLPFRQTLSYELKGPALQKLTGIRNNQLRARILRLVLGSEWIQLMEFRGARRSRPIPRNSRSNDLWFQHLAIVVRDMDEAYAELWEEQVTHVSTAPQTLPDYLPAAAGISAFYFRDPDGHNLELIYFPEGKGDPRWQKAGQDLFMGLDHSAIAVAETESSLGFYVDVLGLKLAGESENYGAEQEHLNQVFGARLLISGLRAPQGMGVELLQYVAPPGGRPYPRDSRPTDLWHWHTTVRVDDIEAMYRKLQDANADFISSGIVSISTEEPDYERAFLVRDPDGHALLIVE